MNDPVTPSQRRRPPQAGKKPPMSRESRFVGYMVLGFGILAVIAVIIIALGNRVEAPDQSTAQTQVQTLAKDLVVAQPVVPPEPKKELNFERKPKFDAAKMEGDWQGAIGKYTAVLQLKNGVYQIILAQPDPMAPRMYSTGNYKVLEDIIMLTPRLDWPAPKSAAADKVTYRILTRSPFPVISVFDGKKMLWQNPPHSEKRVLVPNSSPIFLSEDVSYVVLQKLD